MKKRMRVVVSMLAVLLVFPFMFAVAGEKYKRRFVSVENPLLQPLAQQHHQKVKELLHKRGAKIPMKFVQEALLEAAYYGMRDIVEVILDKLSKFEVWDALDKDGVNPVIATAMGLYTGAPVADRLQILKLLVEMSMGVTNRTWDRGYSAILILAYPPLRGQGRITPQEIITLISFLLDKGADVDDEDLHGETPLVLASLHKEPDLAQFLLGRGASPNVSNSSGTTPLMYAARADNVETARILLAYGADRDTKDIYGDTALDHIRKWIKGSVEGEQSKKEEYREMIKFLGE